MTRHDLTDGLDNNAIFQRQAGVAIGRFDPADPSAGTTDFNQQIAVLYDILDSGQLTSHAAVRLYTVNPPTSFTPVWKWTTDINGPIEGVLVAPLQVGDLQGRSLLLGAPEKTTVANHTQPDTVLGMPPMHVDYIVPPDSSTNNPPPEVLNVNVFPDSFNTAYSFQTTTSAQASRQSSTSYTASTKESAEGKVSYGVPDVDSVSVEVKTSATQTHQSTVSNTYNTYSSQTYTFNTATVFDDKVAATSETMNIYSYPVIGQTICPAANPSCTDSERVPLYIQYSAPDNILHIPPTDAAGLEWFQPPNEPGNLFSYPGSFTLLKAGGPQQLDLLTPSNTEWASSSMGSFSVEWNNSSSAAFSSGSVSTHSFDTSVTVSGEASFEGGGVSGSASVDYNQSTSVSTLNTATQTFGESTGVTLNRVEVENSDFLYAGQSYIFGQSAPSGTIQTDLKLSTDVKSTGYLQVGHAALAVALDRDRHRQREGVGAVGPAHGRLRRNRVARPPEPFARAHEVVHRHALDASSQAQGEPLPARRADDEPGAEHVLVGDRHDLLAGSAAVGLHSVRALRVDQVGARGVERPFALRAQQPVGTHVDDETEAAVSRLHGLVHRLDAQDPVVAHPALAGVDHVVGAGGQLHAEAERRPPSKKSHNT